MQFIKYHSLGNDFILLDWMGQSDAFSQKHIQSPEWKKEVIQLCDRHFGIGADGVLILKKGMDGTEEMLIFNSDGSQAEICLNGIRCCAHHRYMCDSQSTTIRIQAGKQSTCSQIICGNDSQSPFQIQTHISSALYEQAVDVSLKNRIIHGHRIDVGNPHYVVFEKTDFCWLSSHGSSIEQHELFPNKTNVEFVWQESGDSPSDYRVLVYERGCGMTLACSSGAAAITKALHHLGKLPNEETIYLHMPGGCLGCEISRRGEISLTGTAGRVFSGTM
jgi:diaminopimelate epimerase